jgi:hypothetical protein
MPGGIGVEEYSPRKNLFCEIKGSRGQTQKEEL